MAPSRMPGPKGKGRERRCSRSRRRTPSRSRSHGKRARTITLTASSATLLHIIQELERDHASARREADRLRGDCERLQAAAEASARERQEASAAAQRREEALTQEADAAKEAAADFREMFYEKCNSLKRSEDLLAAAERELGVAVRRAKEDRDAYRRADYALRRLRAESHAPSSAEEGAGNDSDQGEE